MILQMISTNPQFSFVLRKNPDNGMLVREIRKGFGYGWFTNPQTYNIYFKDADNDVSYKKNKDDQFEYLNTTRYNSPLAVLGMINEFLDSAIKKKAEEDQEGFTNTVFIPLIHIEATRYIRFFQDNFTDYSIHVEEKAGKSHTVSISTTKTVQDLLNYTSLFALFLSIFAEEYLDLNDDLITKFVKIINQIDAPFYIRYLFGRNVLTGRERFSKFKKELESTDRYAIQLSYGNTAIQRRDKIKSLLTYDKAIVDIGCGEGFYVMPFARNLRDHQYHAIDIDEELVNIVSKKAKKAQLDNVHTYTSVDNFLDHYEEEKVDVLLTEVLEHMDSLTAESLLLSLIDNIDFDKLIITTPNAEFNSFYAIDHFRHEDHKWEMTSQEFQSWIESLCGNRCQLQFFGIGDTVNGIPTTQGVLLKKLA